MFANEIHPYKSNAHHRYKSCDAFRVAHVGVLDVEAGGFHGLESRLNLPASLIGQDSTFRTVEAYEDLQFRNSVGVLFPAPGKIDIFTLVKEELIVEFLFSYPEVIEEPPCPYSLASGRLDNPEVLPDTYVIPDAPAIQPSNPFLSDELHVSDQTVDAVLSEKADEPFHDFLTFFPIGIASFRKKTENQRESDSLVCHAQHQYVDVELSELPVGAVHAQNEFCLDRQQRENHADDDVEVNFDQVLGSSNFHGEKSPNFSFKLLIFRDFYKYNQLKFRCLTA